MVALIASNPYQQDRLTGFLNPGGDPGGAGYQSVQAEIALAPARVMGVEVARAFRRPSICRRRTPTWSRPCSARRPVSPTNFIGLFGMFGYAGFRAAHRARDRYSKLLAAVLTSILGQATINLFAVLGLALLTGVPLPFVSYGGTSLIVTLTAAGLILNVARRPAAAAASSRPKRASRASQSLRAGGRAVEETGAHSTARREDQEKESWRRHGSHSGRRHSGPRGAGDRRRRRAAR